MPRRAGRQLPGTVATSAAVAAAAPELSRRQLEYWVEMGWVLPAEPPARGHPRAFSAFELKVLGLMYRLVAAGFPARNAAWIARAALTAAQRHPGDRLSGVKLVDGIWLQIEV